MPHKNPTLLAETQVLDPAHPFTRVGSGGPHHQSSEDAFSDRLEIISQCFEEKDLLTENLTEAERLQLSEVARLSLEDEIELMRGAIKMLGRAAKRVEEGEPFDEELGKAVDSLGLSCSRIANLMRVQLLLQGPQSAGLLDDLIEAMSDFVEKMTAEEEQQSD